MANNVATYHYLNLFAPPLTNLNGSLLNVLRFVLTTGALTPWPVTSITRSGTTATATVVSTQTLANGMSVTISGASDSLYNGTFPITIASATTFTYTMSGTPAASPAVGTLVMTPAPQAVTSITRSGSTATATLTIGDTTMVTGDLHTIAGAAQSEYNGTFPITVLSSTQFTFQVTGTPTTPATGTITHYKAGAGWTEPFTGTNKCAFLPGATNNSARFYLRVLDDGSLSGAGVQAAGRGYETMSDVDTGTGPFPTVVQATNGLYWRKSTDGTTPRVYLFAADDRFFIYHSDTQASPAFSNSGFFGWFPSNKPADAYNCAIGGDVTVNSNSSISCWVSPSFAFSTGSNSVFIARGVAQTGGAVAAVCSAMAVPGTVLGSQTGKSTDLAYPSAAHGGLVVQPVYIGEFGVDRGRLPAYVHGHSVSPVFSASLGDKFTTIQGLPGVTLMYLTMKSTTTIGSALVDITGPWA